MTIRYPWPTYASPLQCVVADIRLDGKPISDDLVDVEHRRVHLDGIGDWETLDCQVAARTDEPYPAGSASRVSYALVCSTPTNRRTPFALQGEPATGRITVDRVDVAGSFSVDVQVGAHLKSRLRVIGASEPWTFVLDRREAPAASGKPPFDFVWVDFTSSDAPPLARAYRNSLALMELTPAPRLLLNSGVSGLQLLLYTENARAERKRTKDILTTSIARHVAATLLRAAAKEVALTGDPAQPPTTSLYRQACEAIADHMPSVGSVDDLYGQFVADADCEIDGSELWLRIELALESLTSFSNAVGTASEQVAHG